MLNAWAILLLVVALLIPSSIFAQSESNEKQQLISKLADDSDILNVILKFELSRIDKIKSFDDVDSILHILQEISFLENLDESKYFPIQHEWETTKRDLKIQSNITDLLSFKEKIHQIYDAVFLIQLSENITKRISDTENLPHLKSILKSKWNSVKSGLANAKSTDDVLKHKLEIGYTEKILDSGLRLYDKTNYLKANQLIDPTITHTWSLFLNSISESTSITSAHSHLTEYIKKFSEIENKLIAKSESEYKKHIKNSQNLGLSEQTKEINKILDSLHMAKSIKSNKNPFDNSNDEIINHILYKSGTKFSEIDSKIKYYHSDEYQKNQDELKEKSLQLQKIIDDTYDEIPVYHDILYKIENRLSYSKTLDPIELEKTQHLTSALFFELENLYREYKFVKNYSPIYESDQLSAIDKKTIYFELLDDILKILDTYDDSRFDQYRKEFYLMIEDAQKSIEIGSFKLGHEKTYDALKFLKNNLLEDDPRIIFNVSFDDSQNLWDIDGGVYKHSFNSRGKMSFVLYDVDGNNIGELDFLNTKHGEFKVLWHKDVSPGLYIAKISHGNSHDYQIISIQNEHGTKFSQKEIEIMSFASQYEKLENFLHVFGGDNYKQYDSKFTSIIQTIQSKLKEGTTSDVQKNIDELKKVTQRYIPIHSTDAIIEADNVHGMISISGKVSKLIDFREALFISIFDENGKRIYEKIIYDDSKGNFEFLLVKPAQSGLVVVQLEYHDFVATDIISIT